MKMTFLFFLLLGGLCNLNVAAQDPKYVFSEHLNPVQYKNYYLLTLLQQNAAVKKGIQNDLELTALFKSKSLKIADAVRNCETDVTCLSTAFKFTEEEIAAVSKRLTILFKQDESLSNMVKNELIPSGCYLMYGHLKPVELLIKAWEQDAKALNFTIGVYVAGAKPNYPKIDSIAFNVKDKSYLELVRTNAVLSSGKSDAMFFEPAITFALTALEINERDEAGDFEPMRSGVNKASISAISTTSFASYKYSLILVPGEGPEERDVELSAGGMLRCRLAAIEYHQGLAPFIMVSGGRVHPFKTKYNEAYEMKKYLVEKLKIPESVVIMEPQARHTTTNMRNAARIMFRYGIPMDRAALTVTAISQSRYIGGALLGRCVQELGYEPYKLGKRLSDFALEFYPNVMSLQIDFDEPMDP
ncbi:YdcF family protein [Pedobacter sp. N36a]|uniref:YdcF family protein n=1 Tax=Pedobacter sp. N36a TaxID=2767996 RepID=UPI0016570C11|nr:YdcF family protein [Pedobacter sp. N36a]MBC8985249.1 YdcF family protein [Pedobacter sp. N36a]